MGFNSGFKGLIKGKNSIKDKVGQATEFTVIIISRLKKGIVEETLYLTMT